MDTTPGAPHFDDLLSHAAWVRGLAGSLVAQSSDADDVAQEAWIAALERPPGGDENLRGWFASVVRNAVRMRRRSGLRSADREALVAEERAGITAASSAELAQRIETQRLLARQVLALEEPYRTTIILRFYEGLSAAEIARRTKVPAGTVRWRLKTALDQLRGSLDEDFGGQRAAWMALVVPLAPRDLSLAAGAVTGTGLLHGLLAMNLGMKLAAVATVTLLALALSPIGADLVDLVGSFRSVDDTPLEVSFRPIESAIEAPPLEEQAERTPAVRTPSVLTEVPSEQDSSALARLPIEGFQGRIVDGNGDVVSGVGVSFLGFRASRVDTDAQGDFLLPFGAVAPEVAETLLLEHPMLATRRFNVRAQAEALVELGDILMLSAGAIEGRVVTADGLPAEGAWVTLDRNGEALNRRDYHQSRCQYTARLRGSAIRTDASGRFRLDGVEVGQVFVWAGREGDLATRTQPIEVRGEMISDGVEIVLGEKASEDFIGGQVFLPDGAPAVHARLDYEYSTRLGGSGNGTFNADAEGRFLLSCVPAGLRTIRARDYERNFAPVRATDVEGGAQLVLQLQENQYLDLEVGGEGGTLLVPHIWGFDPAHRKVLVRADSIRFEDGVYRVPIPNEPFLLEVQAEGHELKQLGPFEGSRAPREIRVLLAQLPGLRGTVTSGGSVIQGAEVELYALTRETVVHNGCPVRVNPAPKARAKSDSQGAYRLTFREAGEYIVRIHKDGLAPSELGPFTLDPAIGMDGLSCSLNPGGAIVGRVATVDGTSPAGRIVVVSRGDANARTQRCFFDGSFRFDNLMPGRWWVGLVEEEILPGHRMTSTDSGGFDEASIEWNSTVTEGQTTHFDVGEPLREQVVLEGSLRIDGQPPKGFFAQLLPDSGARLNQSSREPLGPGGTFRLTSDVPGRYRISIHGDEESSGLVTAVMELSVGTTRLDIAYDTGQLLVRNAKSLGPDDLAMEMVLARGEGFCVLFPLMPDAEGNVQLKNVPAQRVEVRRYSRDALDQRDPLSGGRVLQAVDVPLHGEASIELE